MVLRELMVCENFHAQYLETLKKIYYIKEMVIFSHGKGMFSKGQDLFSQEKYYFLKAKPCFLKAKTFSQKKVNFLNEK